MILAVIFGQRWTVIDARAPVGPMSATSVVTTNSLCAKGVGPCKRQVLALAVRSEGTRPGRRSVGGDMRFSCRFTAQNTVPRPGGSPDGVPRRAARSYGFAAAARARRPALFR